MTPWFTYDKARHRHFKFPFIGFINDWLNCLSLLINLNKIPSNCDLTKLSSGFSTFPRSLNFGPLLIISRYWEPQQVLQHRTTGILCTTMLSVSCHITCSFHSPISCSFHLFTLPFLRAL